MKKRMLAVFMAVVMAASMAMGCGGKEENNNSAKGSETSEAVSDEAEKSIILISKCYQNQFYQTIFKGAEDAAKEFGFTLTTNGPDAESNISQQVDQVVSAVNKKPTVIGIAACDPGALQDVLVKAKDAEIPVIGFDSGVPGDESGAVVASVATDNEKAGALVADKLFENEEFQKKVMAGTEKKPAVIGILAQDTASGSIVNRVNGFINELVKQLQTLDGMKDAVEVTGQTLWNQSSEKAAKIRLEITVPPTTTQADEQTAASTMLNNKDMVALFAANLGTVDALLSATADGNDLNHEKGKYKDLIVVGFDAGKGQKQAVRSGAFLGSGTQDPYTIGYEAVRLANDIYEGKATSDVDTGAVFYTSENMDDEEMAMLLYD